VKTPLWHRLLRRVGFEPIRKRNGGFYGAIQSRLTSDWNPQSQGPIAEQRGSLRTLRDRARDLEKNNPLVRRYLHLVAENVVGHRGIRLQCANTLPNGLPNRTANAEIERAFCAWHLPKHCTMDGRQSWVDLQRDVIRTMARDGEAFVRLVRGGPQGFALQHIDAALVDETHNLMAGENRNAIKLGIEVDAWDRPVAYHVLTGHINDEFGMTRQERVRIPADEMLHLFVSRRPGAVRGETWLAPVLLSLRMLDGYAEAELVAARTAAAKMGFVITNPENAAPTDPDAPVRSEMEAAPGVIDFLDPGQTFEQWDPTHPSQNFALFVTQIGKFIAAGLNVSFAGLTSDLRETNFSSARIGLLQERDGWRVLQAWLSEHFCEPVYQEWREVAWARGDLAVRMVPSQYGRHAWRPRGWAYTNPQQELQADMLAIAAGLTSPQRVVADNGDDLEDIYAELDAAKQLADEYDVDLYVPNSVISNDQDTPEDAADGSAESDADGGSGRDGDAGRGRRPDSRLALLRAAR
jgi:lambda family phage portal protein